MRRHATSPAAVSVSSRISGSKSTPKRSKKPQAVPASAQTSSNVIARLSELHTVIQAEKQLLQKVHAEIQAMDAQTAAYNEKCNLLAPLVQRLRLALSIRVAPPQPKSPDVAVHALSPTGQRVGTGSELASHHADDIIKSTGQSGEDELVEPGEAQEPLTITPPTPRFHTSTRNLSSPGLSRLRNRLLSDNDSPVSHVSPDGAGKRLAQTVNPTLQSPASVSPSLVHPHTPDDRSSVASSAKRSVFSAKRSVFIDRGGYATPTSARASSIGPPSDLRPKNLYKSSQRNVLATQPPQQPKLAVFRRKVPAQADPPPPPPLQVMEAAVYDADGAGIVQEQKSAPEPVREGPVWLTALAALQHLSSKVKPQPDPPAPESRAINEEVTAPQRRPAPVSAPLPSGFAVSISSSRAGSVASATPPATFTFQRIPSRTSVMDSVSVTPSLPLSRRSSSQQSQLMSGLLRSTASGGKPTDRTPLPVAFFAHTERMRASLAAESSQADSVGTAAPPRRASVGGVSAAIRQRLLQRSKSVERAADRPVLPAKTAAGDLAIVEKAAETAFKGDPAPKVRVSEPFSDTSDKYRSRARAHAVKMKGSVFGGGGSIAVPSVSIHGDRVGFGTGKRSEWSDRRVIEDVIHHTARYEWAE